MTSHFTTRVTAAESSTQILIVDSTFNVVASGIGRLVTALVPGIYKARFNAGNRTDDQLFEVSDAPIQVNGRQLAFTSPLPLPGTLNYRTLDYTHSRELARSAPFSHYGSGAQLLVYARDSQHQPDTPWLGNVPWRGLSVRSLDRSLNLAIDELGLGILDRTTGCAGTKLALTPGLVLLSQDNYSAQGLSLQLPIALCEGWCTHVYLDAPIGTKDRLVDLGAAAVMMTRIQSSEIDDDIGRLTELARQQFLRGEQPVSREQLAELIHSDLELPMLALYAAHSLIAAPAPDWQLIGELARKLMEWLPSGHPDVSVICEALGTQNESNPSRSMLWPPMLSASWQLATRISAPIALDAQHTRRFGQYRVTGSMWAYLLRPREADRPTAARTRATAPAGIPSRQELLQLKSLLNPAHSPFKQSLRRRLLDLAEGGERVEGWSPIYDLAHQFNVDEPTAREAVMELVGEAHQRSLAAQRPTEAGYHEVAELGEIELWRDEMRPPPADHPQAAKLDEARDKIDQFFDRSLRVSINIPGLRLN